MGRPNVLIVLSCRHYATTLRKHPKDWDLFTDALTYAYNTQTHSSTQVAPFELILSRKPSALALEAQPTIREVGSQAQFKEKWREWLAALVSTAQRANGKAQSRYKANFDRRLRRAREEIVARSRVFVRKDYANPRTDVKHKLATVTTGLYEVIEANSGTVVIGDGEKRERVSRDRVVLAPGGTMANRSNSQIVLPYQCGTEGAESPTLIDSLSAITARLADMPPPQAASRNIPQLGI